MKRIILIFVFGILCLTLYSQQKTYISYKKSGLIRESLSFINDTILHGRCVSFNKEDVILAEAFYHNGLKDGRWRIWDDEGHLVYEMYYKKGEKVGVWKMYNKEGIIIEKREFN
ncbi:MAG: toxin-antitoxin system YwqK family antitoxin [Nanoarchaeota archaeon]